MSQVILYTTSYCSYCLKAKQFLQSKCINFTEINVEDDEVLRESVAQKFNWYTVPIIVVEDRCIGGYDDMMRLYAEGKFLVAQ